MRRKKLCKMAHTCESALMLAMLVLIIKQYATNCVCDSCHFAVLQIWTSNLHSLWAEEMSCKRVIALFPHQLRSPTQLLLKTQATCEHTWVCGQMLVAPNANHMVNWNWTWCVLAIGSHSRGNQFAAMVAGRHGGQFNL